MDHNGGEHLSLSPSTLESIKKKKKRNDKSKIKTKGEKKYENKKQNN